MQVRLEKRSPVSGCRATSFVRSVSPFGAYELYKAHLDDRMLGNERNHG